METHPLLRLSLAVLTIGSLLTIAIINLVSLWGPWQGALVPEVCFPGGGSFLDPGNL